MITIGGAKIIVVDSDPNGNTSGNAGDLALSKTGALYVCSGGTIWNEI